MIRKDFLELAAIAADLFEATDFMGDIIDGDCCGDIGNESAARDLENLRVRFRSHAVYIRCLAYDGVHAADKATTKARSKK